VNLPAPFHTHRGGHASSDALAGGAQQSVVQLHEAAQEPGARNGRADLKRGIDPPESEESLSPLWAVAIGTACLLGAMAVVITLG
jgi:hypothetical protein